jgi:hypothetical protein
MLCNIAEDRSEIIKLSEKYPGIGKELKVIMPKVMNRINIFTHPPGE